MKTKNLVYYSVVFIIVMTAKLAYTFTTNDTLIFILKPLGKLVSLVAGSNFVYTDTSGFYFENLNITIDKSCSGINFWLISFVIFSIELLRICKSHIQKLILIPLIIITTYILTLFANTSRILTSIVIEKQIDFNPSWLHQAEGVFIYLSFLIIIYLLLNRSLSKFNNYDEKLT